MASSGPALSRFAWICGAVVLTGLVFACSGDDSPAAASSGVGGAGGTGPTTTGTGTSTVTSGGSGASPGLGECVGVCEPTALCTSTGDCSAMTQCDTDADCPATDHDYTANGPRCLEICGAYKLCRTPCTMPCPTSTSCHGIADDGTEYCEIGLQLCDETTACGEYLACWPNFRPKP